MPQAPQFLRDFGKPIVFDTNEVDELVHALTGYEGEDNSLTVLQNLINYVANVWPDKTAKQVLSEYEESLIDATPPSPSGGWRPIETAPKDGTVILLYTPAQRPPDNEPFAGCWALGNVHCTDDLADKDYPWLAFDPSTGGLNAYMAERPTHWMPLPSPPGASSSPAPALPARGLPTVVFPASVVGADAAGAYYRAEDVRAALPAGGEPSGDKLLAFVREVAELTIRHDSLDDHAVVYPSKLGEALAKVDPNWHGWGKGKQEEGGKIVVTRSDVLPGTPHVNDVYALGEVPRG